MPYVEYDLRDHVATITINRPDRMNALGRDIVRGLTDAWQRFHEDDSARVAILTGTGRAFCVGEDLKESVEANRAGAAYEVERDLYWNGKIDKLVIAAVNGYALGGGLALVSRSDLRVAASTAIFQNAGILRGWVGGFEPCVTQGLTYPAGAALALGDRIDARQAYALGLVNRVVELDQLLPEARAWAARIAELPPLAVRETVRLLHQVRPALDAQQQAKLAEANDWLATTEDAMESRRSFVEKRPPVYHAR